MNLSVGSKKTGDSGLLSIRLRSRSYGQEVVTYPFLHFQASEPTNT